MEQQKNLGIWMDHLSASLFDLSSVKKSHSIHSKFTGDAKDEALNRSEHTMHNKRQQLNEAYYKEIAAHVVSYNHVLLFGPTDAKSELHNYLNKDLHFKDVIFDVEAADKMTDVEKEMFVKKHFNK